MLKRLIIDQFVIIDRLNLEMQSGLTVLTGETGAGKSILLDSLGLILGDASLKRAIREGSDKATFEATFEVPEKNPVWKFFAENGMGIEPAQKEFTIRRVMHVDQNSDEEIPDDITINGKTVSVENLKIIGTYLCEIHGQHANHTLLDPSNQLNLLDLSCNSFPPDLFNQVATALRDLQRFTKEREEEQTFMNRNIASLATLEALVGRFKQTGLHEQSLDDQEAEYFRLLTAHETSEAFQEITANLVASNGAIKSLTSAQIALTRQKNLDQEKMVNLTAHIESAIKAAREAVQECRRLGPEYDIDTRPLRMYKDRITAMEALSDELQVEIDDLPAYYEELDSKVNRLRRSRERIAELTQAMQKAEKDYRHHAHILTEHRITAGKVLSESINKLLPPLKLMGAEFKVLVEERQNTPWTERGFNTVTFTARMNPGQPFSPISETASGGELARLVLALKAVLQTILTIPTLVFDEVDTGIGGAAAAAVGEKIAEISSTTQVLVITHSPQVASRGDQQLHVSKRIEGDTTISVVRTLNTDERANEISRMLAGDTITAEALSAAKMLLSEAAAAAAKRRHALKNLPETAAPPPPPPPAEQPPATA
jgi:DNA repair protein RecN (Recombination protein N)